MLVEPEFLTAPTSGTVLRALRNPLLRNGHLLTLSSALTAIIGLAFWSVAAWSYDPATVGKNSAAISMVTLAAAIAQLNLSSAVVRFVPTAGDLTRRFVAGVYLLCGSTALVISVCSVALVHLVAPDTGFLEGTWPRVMFVVATVAYTIFVIQDGVLTALRRTALVPLENFVFSVAKLGLVVVLAGLMPVHGIFASLTLSLVGAVLVVGAFIFLSAIPGHQRTAGAAGTAARLPPVRQLARFVAYDYIGSVLSIGSITLVPIIIVAVLGPEQNAFFSVAWLIGYSVCLININMGTSLVVESAADQTHLARQIRHMLAHTSKLVAGAVLALLVSAPYLLGIFGDAYQDADDTLRLVGLAGLPNLLVVAALSSARAQRRMGLVLLVDAALCALLLPLTWLLLPLMGVTGAGMAWLITQSVIALGLLIRRDVWLTTGIDPTTGDGAFGVPRLRFTLAAFGIRLVSAMRLRQPIGRAAAMMRGPRPDEPRASPTVLGPVAPVTWTVLKTIRRPGSDVTMAYIGEEEQPPAAVLKVGVTPPGAREMHTHRDVLAILSADLRLDEQWRELLPQILDFRETENGPQSLESFLPAVDLSTALEKSPESFEALTTEAITVIAELHRGTGTVALVDERHLEMWVNEPLAVLAEMCRSMAPKMQYAPVLDRLGTVLRHAFTGQHVLVGWGHGDFTPGNVRLASDHGPVTGIIDWGGARPGQLAALDCYHMLLTARTVAEGRELGAVVKSLVRAGRLTAGDRLLLENACGPTLAGDIDERALILAAWLHHVVQMRRKRVTYLDLGIWWALNVQPVLRALSGLSPVPASSARIAEPATYSEPAMPLLDGAAVKHSVTVVICAYTDDRWDDTVRAVASVQRQTEPPDEIVLVVDYCPGLLDRATNNLHGVTVRANQYEKGLSGARNTGISVATGDVVAFLDDDAVATRNWLAALVAPYANPQVLGVGGRVLPNWLTSRPRWFPTEFDWVVGCSYRGQPTESAPVRNFIGANMSMRRDVLAESGGFDTSLGRIASRPLGCEETELCIRLARAHPSSVHLYEPAAEVLHSVPDSRGTWSYFRSRCYAEGLSKAIVTGLEGADRGLATERTYLSSTIPRAALSYVGQGLRGQPWQFAAALALVVGVTTTAMGYAAGKLHMLRTDAKNLAFAPRVAQLARLIITLAIWQGPL